MYTYQAFGDRYVLSLENHVEITKAMTMFCEEKQIKAGVIHGIGAVGKATLRFFDPHTKQYIDKTFQEQMEIACLIGNISQKLISSFRNFSSKDKSYIDSLSTSFRSLFLNDSIWVRATDVEEKLPIMKDKLNKRFINQFLEQRDSTNIYLVKINNFLDSSDYAPIEYVSPTLKQIILNKRKSNYINNLEKEIITNAIKKKQCELYEEN